PANRLPRRREPDELRLPRPAAAPVGRGELPDLPGRSLRPGRLGVSHRFDPLAAAAPRPRSAGIPQLAGPPGLRHPPLALDLVAPRSRRPVPDPPFGPGRRTRHRWRHRHRRHGHPRRSRQALALSPHQPMTVGRLARTQNPSGPSSPQSAPRLPARDVVYPRWVHRDSSHFGRVLLHSEPPLGESSSGDDPFQTVCPDSHLLTEDLDDRLPGDFLPCRTTTVTSLPVNPFPWAIPTRWPTRSPTASWMPS